MGSRYTKLALGHTQAGIRHLVAVLQHAINAVPLYLTVCEAAYDIGDYQMVKVGRAHCVVCVCVCVCVVVVLTRTY